MATVDLTIRGAGIFGLSIAWTALQHGATLRVIDPHGVAAGSSGGVVGALQPHTPDVWNDKKQFQFESLRMAPAFWNAVEAASGISSGYTAAGRLQPLADERATVLARARKSGAEENWGDAASWNVIPESKAGDWRPISETGLLIHDTLSALIHPRHACQSLAAALRTRGVDIVRDGPDEGQIIWATGWLGLKELTKHLGTPVGTGVKGQAALLRHAAAGHPQIFASGIHIVPHLDGTVAIGSTSERNFDDATSTDTQIDDLIDRAARVLPVLKGARVVERWAGVRPRAASRAPLLDAWPDRPGHFIANGGFKIGFGMAPKVAEVMCDLVLDRKDTIPDDFRF